MAASTWKLKTRNNRGQHPGQGGGRHLRQEVERGQHLWQEVERELHLWQEVERGQHPWQEVEREQEQPLVQVSAQERPLVQVSVREQPLPQEVVPAQEQHLPLVQEQHLPLVQDHEQRWVGQYTAPPVHEQGQTCTRHNPLQHNVDKARNADL